MKNTRSLNFLMVEDDRYFRQKIKSQLQSFGHFCEAETRQQAEDLIAKNAYDLILIDMNLQERNEGIQILKKAKEKAIYSIILTDNSNEEIIRTCYELGCDDYLTKDQCEIVIEFIVRDKISDRFDQRMSDFFQSEFITQDDSLINTIKSLKSSFMHNQSILLLGETGVGKSKVAELIHKMNGGKEDNFVALNVSAIPENLIESELFGHTRGSFTGAVENKIGKLKLAEGGTLFLDEIGSMPLFVQKKLLKVLEEKTFYPLGASKPVHSEFRIISATCDNLQQMIQDERFRTDLFYRINGIVIDIPPLRRRSEDIPLLIRHFLRQNSRRVYIHEEAMKGLKQYSWPGNIRELKSLIDKLAAKKNGIVEVKDLPQYILTNGSSLALNSAPKDQFITEEQLHFIKCHGLKAFLDRCEIEIFKEITQENESDIQAVQELLGLSRSGYYRLQKRALDQKTP